jgi:ABC-type branched-subunit amino acid transport system substrate-binding protein
MDADKRVIGGRQAIAIGVAVVAIAGLVTLASVGHHGTAHSVAGSLPGATSTSAATSDTGAVGAVDRTKAARHAAAGGRGTTGAPRSVPSSSSFASAGTTPFLPVGRGVRGVTNKVIQVGVPTMDYAAVARAGFAPSNSNIDDSFAVKAATDWVNKHGGIAGRKVQVVEYRVSVNNETTATGRQNEDQAACAKFTQDNHVFAMSGDNMTEDNYLECAKQNNVPAIFSSIGNDAPSNSRLSSMRNNWYATTGFVADRRERAMAKFLLQRGFLKKGDSFALVIEDKSGIKEAVQKEMKPALAAAGLTPAAEVVYTDGLQQNWSTAILQFQQHVPPVTKVVFSATTQDMFAPYAFMRAAESQQYRPKYALGSDEHPNQLNLGTSANQLANVFAMGWMPWSDVGDSTDLTPATRDCGQAMMAEGISASPPNYASCEFLFFLRDAFKRAPEVSPMGLAAGVAKLGGAYRPVFAKRTLYTSGRHDGAEQVREVRYGVDPSSCGGSSPCLHYTTGPLPVPN